LLGRITSVLLCAPGLSLILLKKASFTFDQVRGSLNFVIIFKLSSFSFVVSTVVLGDSHKFKGSLSDEHRAVYI